MIVTNVRAKANKLELEAPDLVRIKSKVRVKVGVWNLG